MFSPNNLQYPILGLMVLVAGLYFVYPSLTTQSSSQSAVAHQMQADNGSTETMTSRNHRCHAHIEWASEYNKIFCITKRGLGHFFTVTKKHLGFYSSNIGHSQSNLQDGEQTDNHNDKVESENAPKTQLLIDTIPPLNQL